MLLALVSLIVLLSGCLKLDMDVTVSEDDTLSGTLIFAFDKAMMQAAGQKPEDILAGSQPLPADLQGVTQKPYEDDKYQGVQYTFEGLPLDKWNNGTQTDIKIEHVGDEFKVTGNMDLSTPDTGTGDPAMDEQLKTAFASAQIRIKLTFPGAVKESNGQVDGNSVTWEPKFGEATELSATASAVAGGGNTMLLLIIGGVVLLLVIVGIVALAARKGKKGATPGEAEGDGDDDPGSGVPDAPDAPEAPEAPAEEPPAAAPEATDVPDVPDAPADGGDETPSA